MDEHPDHDFIISKADLLLHLKNSLDNPLVVEGIKHSLTTSECYIGPDPMWFSTVAPPTSSLGIGGREHAGLLPDASRDPTLDLDSSPSETVFSRAMMTRLMVWTGLEADHLSGWGQHLEGSENLGDIPIFGEDLRTQQRLPIASVQSYIGFPESKLQYLAAKLRVRISSLIGLNYAERRM